MTLWQGTLLTVIAAGTGAGLYGLHRLALWLEERGQLFYLRKRPTSSASSFLMTCQEFINPNVKHVYRAKEDKRKKQTDPGEKDPDHEDDDTEPKCA